jgi:hypothetical protein
MRHVFWVSTALLVAFSFGGLSIADTPDGWARIQHPEMPVTMDLPEDASYQDVRSFSLGAPSRKDRKPQRVTLFGIRALDENELRFHAVEIAMFWLTDAVRGVEAEDLRSMPRSLHDAEATERFLRRVLYRLPARVEFEDQGLELIDGVPARRAALSRVTAPGTPDQRTVEGSVFLIAPSLDAALAVVVRFDPQSTRLERETMFPNIMRSIRFGSDDDDPLEAQLQREHAPAAYASTSRSRS